MSALCLLISSRAIDGNSKESFEARAMAGAGMFASAFPQLKRVPPSTVQYQRHVSHRLGRRPLSPAGFAQFVNPLPVPPEIRPLPGAVSSISMSAFMRKLHRDLHRRRYEFTTEFLLDPRLKHDVVLQSELPASRDR